MGLTSIGAGSAILMMLMILYRTSRAATVGTDAVLGVLLAGVTGFLQFKLLENVDLLLVASVLAGSIPRSILGFAAHQTPWIRLASHTFLKMMARIARY